jgi:threonine dehydratase
VAGETGAAGIAGLLAEPSLVAGGTVLAIVTEGATDPDAWEAVVGRKPPGVSRA